MKIMEKEKFDKINVFGQGEPNDGFAQYFSGASFLKVLHNSQNNGGIFTANVTFEPGCRNNWHIHHAQEGGGQMLICMAGEGWYQEEGKEAVSLIPGTVISISPGVRHWHGAKKDSWFSHIALEVPGIKCSNEWCEPVSDEIANVAELLMSSRGAFITGADFLVDGGATAAYFYGPLKPGT